MRKFVREEDQRLPAVSLVILESISVVWEVEPAGGRKERTFTCTTGYPAHCTFDFSLFLLLCRQATVSTLLSFRRVFVEMVACFEEEGLACFLQNFSLGALVVKLGGACLDDGDGGKRVALMVVEGGRRLLACVRCGAPTGGPDLCSACWTDDCFTSLWTFLAYLLGAGLVTWLLVLMQGGK